MGILSNQELAKEQNVDVFGRNYQLRTENKERLIEVAKWLNNRFEALSKKHPLMRSQDLQILLLLELGIEKFDQLENGKSLLKRTDQLLEWLSSDTK